MPRNPRPIDGPAADPRNAPPARESQLDAYLLDIAGLALARQAAGIRDSVSPEQAATPQAGEHLVTVGDGATLWWRTFNREQAEQMQRVAEVQQQHQRMLDQMNAAMNRANRYATVRDGLRRRPEMHVLDDMVSAPPEPADAFFDIEGTDAPGRGSITSTSTRPG